MSVGKVFLVGAGPGDPGLLTCKGRAILERCEVVVYDRLANPCLLDLAPAEAERISVGKGPGTHGHIAIGTNDIERAMAYLRRAGVEFDMASAKGPDGGPLKALYLKEEIAGFAVHLMRR